MKYISLFTWKSSAIGASSLSESPPSNKPILASFSSSDTSSLSSKSSSEAAFFVTGFRAGAVPAFSELRLAALFWDLLPNVAFGSFSETLKIECNYLSIIHNTKKMNTFFETSRQCRWFLFLRFTTRSPRCLFYKISFPTHFFIL